MEMLDVVNLNDQVIGKASREECHNNPNLIHHTVHFTLYDQDNDKVLITQRSFKKSHDSGKYCFLGEHILAGESYEDALLRGVKEELGYSPGKCKEVSKGFFKYDKQAELVKFYIVYYSDADLHWSNDEIESVMWTDRSSIREINYDLSEMARYWIDIIDWNAL